MLLAYWITPKPFVAPPAFHAPLFHRRRFEKII